MVPRLRDVLESLVAVIPAKMGSSRQMHAAAPGFFRKKFLSDTETIPNDMAKPVLAACWVVVVVVVVQGVVVPSRSSSYM